MNNKIEDIPVKREAFEVAYTLSATPEQKKTIKAWLQGWQCKEGYKQSALQDTFIGFCLGRAGHIAIQEAWELAGGNPGIPATKEELVTALKLLDEVCDEAGDKEDAERAEKAVRKTYSPAVTAGDRMQQRRIRSNHIPAGNVKKIKAIGIRLRDFRKAKGLTQAELGKRLSIDQTYISMTERGVITKTGDNGAANLERAEKILADAQKLFKARKAKSAPIEYACLCLDCGNKWIAKKTTPNCCAGKKCKSLRISFIPVGHLPLAEADTFKEKPALSDMHMSGESSHQTSEPGIIPLTEIPRTSIADYQLAISPDNLAIVLKKLGEQSRGRLPRSANIVIGPISTYMRLGKCFFYMGVRQNAIEVARIDIPEKLRGQGLAKRFFESLTSYAYENAFPYIVVAQVHSENFREQLVAWGFTRYQPPGNECDYIYIKDVYK